MISPMGLRQGAYNVQHPKIVNFGARPSAPVPEFQSAVHQDNLLLFGVKRLLDGLDRMLCMSFLREKGWLELALHPLSAGLSLVFPIKHFIEGVFHVDSIVMPRKLPSLLQALNRQKHWHRTMVEALGGVSESEI